MASAFQKMASALNQIFICNQITVLANSNLKCWQGKIKILSQNKVNDVSK